MFIKSTVLLTDLKKTRNWENKKTMGASGWWEADFCLNLFLKALEYYKEIQILRLKLENIVKKNFHWELDF